MKEAENHIFGYVTFAGRPAAAPSQLRTSSIKK